MKFSSNQGRSKDVRLKESETFLLRLPKHYKKTINDLIKEKSATFINDCILLALNSYFQSKGFLDHDKVFDI
jgi:hypothetical protein